MMIGLLLAIVGFVLHALTKAPIIGSFIPVPWLWIWLIPGGIALMFSRAPIVALLIFVFVSLFMYLAGWLVLPL